MIQSWGKKAAQQITWIGFFKKSEKLVKHLGLVRKLKEKKKVVKFEGYSNTKRNWNNQNNPQECCKENG